MIDLTELYVHWWAGRSQVQISDSLGIDRKTVRKYLAPAEEAGMVPGSAEMSPAAWRELIGLWWPATVDAGLRQVTWPVIEAHRDWIKQQLEAGVTQATVHQRLTCEHGLAASSASLRRWVAANLPEETRRGRAAQVRGLRAPAGPGSEAQIDYGKLGRWSDPATGKTVTVWAFVMVLACSRLMFVRPTIRMDQEAWTRAHVEAFAFFGGVPARLATEPLRVLQPHRRTAVGFDGADADHWRQADSTSPARDATGDAVLLRVEVPLRVLVPVQVAVPVRVQRTHPRSAGLRQGPSRRPCRDPQAGVGGGLCDEGVRRGTSAYAAALDGYAASR